MALNVHVSLWSEPARCRRNHSSGVDWKNIPTRHSQTWNYFNMWENNCKMNSKVSVWEVTMIEEAIGCKAFLCWFPSAQTAHASTMQTFMFSSSGFTFGYSSLLAMIPVKKFILNQFSGLSCCCLEAGMSVLEGFQPLLCSNSNQRWSL